MSHPLVHAFFVGRAISEVFYEQLELAVTQTLSEVGKFDAEQRERLRVLVDQVMERANRDLELHRPSYSTDPVSFSRAGESVDLQGTLDDLRAEMAELRSELQRYRSRA